MHSAFHTYCFSHVQLRCVFISYSPVFCHLCVLCLHHSAVFSPLASIESDRTKSPCYRHPHCKCRLCLCMRTQVRTCLRVRRRVRVCRVSHTLSSSGSLPAPACGFCGALYKCVCMCLHMCKSFELCIHSTCSVLICCRACASCCWVLGSGCLP